MDNDALRLLIADDNDSDRLILKTILEKQGYSVRAVANGAEAVEAFQEEKPDLILLDALMPVVDGFQAARSIKGLAGEDVIPIIFITSLKDAPSLVDCLEAGGDDFISKPYNRIILHAKIQAHARMSKLHAVVQEQRDKISVHREHLIREQEVAKAVFDNIAHNGCIHANNIKYLLSPMSVFNGDMVLVAQKPSDGMYVLLGDFTGHGLPAAIGAMPASEIFYGMTKKGFAMEEILRELNTKLQQILPVGVFCCACMIDMSFHEGLVKVWIGGLPDLVIKRKKTKNVELIGSKHLPLGVLTNDRFLTHVEVLQLDVGDKVYLWSDGIHEAVNNEGEMFGKEKLMSVITGNEDPATLFDDICTAVCDYTGNIEQDDDHTMVEVTMIAEQDFTTSNEALVDHSVSSLQTDMDCTLTYEMRSGALKTFNPLPFLTHFFREIPGLKAHSGNLYTIMAELYSNALEHGLLGLSSDLKNSTAGFAQYYLEREQALSQLEDGKIIITFTCVPKAEGGCLIVKVEDSGKGFEHDRIHNLAPTTQGYCGRGIPLITSMCDKVEYKGAGNIVEVHISWKNHKNL